MTGFVQVSYKFRTSFAKSRARARTHDQIRSSTHRAQRLALRGRAQLPRTATEQITHGSWLEQELQLGGARHAVRAKPALAIFQSSGSRSRESNDTRHGGKTNGRAETTQSNNDGRACDARAVWIAKTRLLSFPKPPTTHTPSVCTRRCPSDVSNNGSTDRWTNKSSMVAGPATTGPYAHNG